LLLTNLKGKSKDTQALYLFSIGKTPLEVAIELDLSTILVHEIQEGFWALNQLHELAYVYSEIKKINSKNDPIPVVRRRNGNNSIVNIEPESATTLVLVVLFSNDVSNSKNEVTDIASSSAPLASTKIAILLMDFPR
jgi:hypothetical protein